MYDIGYASTLSGDKYDNDMRAARRGSGKAKVPCEFEKPVNKLEKKTE